MVILYSPILLSIPSLFITHIFSTLCSSHFIFSHGILSLPFLQLITPRFFLFSASILPYSRNKKFLVKYSVLLRFFIFIFFPTVWKPLINRFRYLNSGIFTPERMGFVSYLLLRAAFGTFTFLGH